jgi:hypothetical protein
MDFSRCRRSAPKGNLRDGDQSEPAMVIGLVTTVAVSTLVAAIGVLAVCVEIVQTVEMTDSLAWQTVLNLAVTGSLVQISLLSFRFVWEQYRDGETTSSSG